MIVDVEEVFYGMGTVILGHFPLINESRFGLSEYQTRSDFHKGTVHRKKSKKT